MTYLLANVKLSVINLDMCLSDQALERKKYLEGSLWPWIETDLVVVGGEPSKTTGLIVEAEVHGNKPSTINYLTKGETNGLYAITKNEKPKERKSSFPPGMQLDLKFKPKEEIVLENFGVFLKLAEREYKLL